MKKLMLGNEAVARGAYEAGVRVVSSYPGTPSTEITEYISLYDEIYSEWAPNEKVSAEVALGASIIGARSLCAMKHVGLNVAADLLFTASYTGVNGGFVLCVADDQGMHSSQNEQDSRHFARAAKVMMLEPCDSEECYEYTKTAFSLSEEFDLPVMLRLCTRVSHSRGFVQTKDREKIDLKPYKKDISKYVMAPANAKGRRIVVDRREQTLQEWVNTTPLNKIEKSGSLINGKKVGIIAAGIAYQYAKEALGDRVSYLKLGVVWPLPDKLLQEFAQSVDTLYVIEELDSFIQTHCKSLGIHVIGKEVFTNTFEYTAAMIKEAILNICDDVINPPTLPSRPPVLCPGCPHRATFHVLKQLKLIVSGDIGCYTLAAFPPQSAMDTMVDMGASVSMAHGMEKAVGGDFARRSVAVIGDSTFIHSGITSLIDIVYNKGTTTTLILDNSITGMTGHQHNPATGYTIKNEPTRAVDLVALCRAIGVERVVVADPFDMEKFRKILEAELAANEPSVIIARRPCKLLKGVEYKERYTVTPEKCKNCGACMQIGCPALVRNENKVKIDTTLCVGCGVCTKLCKFGAIEQI